MTSKIVFKVTNKSDNNSDKYYNCSRCNKYSTNKTSNFKPHLITCNPSEYLQLFYSNNLNKQEKNFHLENIAIRIFLIR